MCECVCVCVRVCMSLNVEKRAASKKFLSVRTEMKFVIQRLCLDKVSLTSVSVCACVCVCVSECV